MTELTDIIELWSQIAKMVCVLYELDQKTWLSLDALLNLCLSITEAGLRKWQTQGAEKKKWMKNRAGRRETVPIMQKEGTYLEEGYSIGVLFV